MDELRTLVSLTEALSEHAEKPAIVVMREEGAERWSYTDLGNHVRRLARGLAQKGVSRGDHVALLAGNRPEWVVACLAVSGSGAVIVPLDVRLGNDELSHRGSLIFGPKGGVEPYLRPQVFRKRKER